MTPEAQRIAIAKACPTVAKIDGAGAPVWIRDTREYFDPIEDLNAMKEAENVLGEGIEPYLDLLDQLPPPLYDVRATAAQRAEAFLRAIGKWVD